LLLPKTRYDSLRQVYGVHIDQVLRADLDGRQNDAWNDLKKQNGEAMSGIRHQ